MSLPWVEKYRPQTRSDLVGNEIAINGLFLFLKNWTPNSKYPGVLLLGPAGCGKTSAVHAIANDLGLDVVELNASDTRKKASILTIVAPTAQYQSLESVNTKRVILMDEVDGISGRHDRGGLTELLKIIKNSAYPIICTANDPESKKLDRLKKILRVFEYNRLDEFQIFELLLSIAERENIEVNEIALEEIAAKAAGDIRAAINELESHVYGTDLVQLEERNKMITLTELFNDLYRSKNYEEARKVMNNAPSDYYKILLFLYDNTADQCKNPKEVAVAYEQIAQADLVYNRIMKTQDWSMLKYFFSFIGPGLALARPSNFSKKIVNLPDIPSSFMSRGIAKRVKSKALKLAPVVAPQTHISATRFVNEEFDLFSKIILGNTDIWAKRGAEIAAWLGLDDDQLDELMKINPSSQLLEYIDDARKIVGREHLKQAIEIPDETPFALDSFIATRIKSNTPELDNEASEPIAPEDEQDSNNMTLDDFF